MANSVQKRRKSAELCHKKRKNCYSNLSALRSGLPSNSKTRIESVEGVNHLFQHCKTGAVTEYREIEETLSPTVLETIIQWIARLFFP
jgi:hypothetical protein